MNRSTGILDVDMENCVGGEERRGEIRENKAVKVVKKYERHLAGLHIRKLARLVGEGFTGGCYPLEDEQIHESRTVCRGHPRIP